MKKVKVGYLPLYVKLYDDSAPQLRVRIEGFSNEKPYLTTTVIKFSDD